MTEFKPLVQFEIRKVCLIFGFVQNMFIFSVSHSTHDSLNSVLDESLKIYFIVVRESLVKLYYNAVLLFNP